MVVAEEDLVVVVETVVDEEVSAEEEVSVRLGWKLLAQPAGLIQIT